MNIGIDIRSTLKKQTGIGKYTFNLINALGQIDKANDYYLYSQKKLLDFKRRLPKLPAGNFHHCVDYFKKGPDKVLPEPDIFHTSSYDLTKPRKAGKFILTVHDVIIKAYPYGHSEKTIKEVDGELKRVLGEADLLIADSHNTKSDLMKFYGVQDVKIKVIYPGVVLDSQSLSRAKSRDSLEQYSSSEAEGRVEKYILFVGTIEPRKNIQGLIKAFNLLKKEHNIAHKLIIAGMKGWMYEDIFKEYENSEFKNEIIFKGYVNDKELAQLYRNASVFVYPSFYEGFGFPIVEAFSHGAPVVTSKTSSCGEIAGDGALLINPENYKEIGEAILKIISDSSIRQELIIKGSERAELFTWQNTAIEFLNCLTNT
ncbi:MAG: glycosyltransferase family 1 protein [Candidatus Omnitrophota bacterium]|nr:glycosyltransferase family 1 protein [Candidatus Omnitrophota bacterium]